MPAIVEQRIKPVLRAVKFSALYRRAQRHVQRLNRDEHIPTAPNMAFIIGCGRSGTTILGDAFAVHPDVRYLFEPYHIWAAIDPRTDFLDLYIPGGDSRCFLDESDVTRESLASFTQSFQALRRQSGAALVMEKTPINSLRLGYLDALAPRAKYIHIVRSAMAVCGSINRLASTNGYRISGRPTMNQWWGVGGVKWERMMREGAAAGYFADEVHLLDSHAARGAYEWLVSLMEADRWRHVLGPRLQELTLDEFIEDPAATMRSLCEFLELDAPPRWLKTVSEMIEGGRGDRTLAVTLPPLMCDAFNHMQLRYGFSGRAVTDSPAVTMPGERCEAVA